MGLFDEIAGLAEDVGTEAYRKALKPAGQTIFRGLDEYHAHVISPLVFEVKLAAEHPDTLWSKSRYKEVMREKGLQPYASSRAIRGDRKAQEGIERDLATMPAGQRIPLEIAVDPFTYWFGAGPVFKGAKAGSLALRGGAGARTAARIGATTTAREPIFQSIVAAMAGAPVGEQVAGEPGAIAGSLIGAVAPFGPPTVRGIQRLRARPQPRWEPSVGMDIDPVTGLQSGLGQVPSNPGVAATRLSTLSETTPNLTELAQTIMAEQAREGGILSNRLARPFRFMTNRFVGPANTAKAEALDARVSLEAAKFEQFGMGADTAAVLTDEKFKTLGLVSKFDDELVRLKSGQQATMRELFERTASFKLAPEERAAVEAAKTARKSVHDWGMQSLEAHFMEEGMSQREAAARAAEIIRETPLEEGVDYWPRMAAAVGEEDVALTRPSFFRVGAKAPNLQLPRSVEATGTIIRQSGDPGAVLSRYAQQVFFKVQQETIIKPLLRRLSIGQRQLIPTGMQAAVDGFRARREWIRQAQGLLNRVRGLSAGQLRKQVANLVAADVPDEWKAVIRRLEVDTLTAPQLARPTRVSAKATAEMLAAQKPSGRVPLEKAAKASAAAQRVEKGAEQFKTYIPRVRAVLKALSKRTTNDLSEATRQLKAVERALRRGRGARHLPEHKFPGITELFERTQAEAIEQAFDRLNPQSVPRFVAAINNWVGIGVGVQAGSADIGFITLQMFPSWAANPLALPAMLTRMTRNKSYLAAMNTLQRETFRDGKPMLQQMLGHDLRLVSEPLMPDVMAIQAGNVTGKVAKFVTNWPLNRMFTRGINLARMNVAKYGVRLTEAFKRRALTADEYRQVMKVANTITGDFNWTRAGVGQVQRAGERIGLRFAPTWLRAMLNWVGMAAHPSMSVEANLARLALANTIGVGVGIYSLVGLMIGQTPNLDFRDAGKFMTYRVGGARIGPAGVLVQLARTTGKAVNLADKAMTADTAEEREAALRDLTDIREGRNPIRQFWRAGAPVIGGLIYDMTAGEGVHSYTQRPINLSPEGVRGLSESATPFAVQTALSGEGVPGLLSTLMGGRSFPTSPAEIFIEMADEKAQEVGFRSWEETPKATRADVMRKTPELQAAYDERQAFFAKFEHKQSKEDWVYEEIDKSRSLTEDTLLGMWQGVEAGTRDVSEFRRAFSEMMGNHAYHSSRLMDGVDTDMKRRKGEVLQDYYARLYHAIQPEAFDGKAFPGDFPDGQVSPAEWELWREQRTGFWNEFAEAQQFRSYIETEYPTRNWNSPEMAELHAMKNRMNQSYQEFLDIPKYRGLGVEAGNFVDAVRGLADRKAREIRFALSQRGVDVSKVRVPAKLAWQLVLQDLRQAGLTPEQMKLLEVAILMDLKPQTQRSLLSAERARYLLDHREMAAWYPSAYGDAGLGDREIALLGLSPAPMGASVPERVAAAV